MEDNDKFLESLEPGDKVWIEISDITGPTDIIVKVTIDYIDSLTVFFTDSSLTRDITEVFETRKEAVEHLISWYEVNVADINERISQLKDQL